MCFLPVGLPRWPIIVVCIGVSTRQVDLFLVLDHLLRNIGLHLTAGPHHFDMLFPLFIPPHTRWQILTSFLYLSLWQLLFQTIERIPIVLLATICCCNHIVIILQYLAVYAARSACRSQWRTQMSHFIARVLQCFRTRLDQSARLLLAHCRCRLDYSPMTLRPWYFIYQRIPSDKLRVLATGGEFVSEFRFVASQWSVPDKEHAVHTWTILKIILVAETWHYSWRAQFLLVQKLVSPKRRVLIGRAYKLLFTRLILAGVALGTVSVQLITVSQASIIQLAMVHTSNDSFHEQLEGWRVLLAMQTCEHKTRTVYAAHYVYCYQ